jgi:hypothetical protein
MSTGSGVVDHPAQTRASAHVTPRGGPDQLRSTIRRIRNALNHAEPLELVDVLADRLGGHLRLICELAQPRPVDTQVPEHAVVSRLDAREPGLVHPALDLFD